MDALAQLLDPDVIREVANTAKDLISSEFYNSIIQIQKLENLEAGSARIESVLSRVDAVAAKLEATTATMNERSEAMFVSIEKKLVTDMRKLMEHVAEVVKNTTEKASINASKKAGRWLFVELLPLTVATSVLSGEILNRLDQLMLNNYSTNSAALSVKGGRKPFAPLMPNENPQAIVPEMQIYQPRKGSVGARL